VVVAAAAAARPAGTAARLATSHVTAQSQKTQMPSHLDPTDEDESASTAANSATFQPNAQCP